MGSGIGAVSELAKAKCSDLQKMEFKMQFRKFIIALIEKTVEIKKSSEVQSYTRNIMHQSITDFIQSHDK